MSNIIIIEYDALAQETNKTMTCLYAALDEPAFDHDFTAISFERRAYDEDLGMPGLHILRPVIGRHYEGSCLPPDIIKRYTGSNFWHDQWISKRALAVIKL